MRRWAVAVVLGLVQAVGTEPGRYKGEPLIPGATHQFTATP